MSTDLTMGQKLEQYGDAAEAYKAAQESYDQALAQIDPIKATVAEARTRVEAAVETLGSDPFKVLKGGKGTGAQRGPRGPRDPEKRNRVLAAMNGRTVSEIMEETGLDKGYINGVINSERKKERVATDGERGSQRYTYHAPSVEQPVAA